MWRNGLSLHTPHLYGDQSYLSFHLVPIFLPATLISWLVPLSAPQFFSAFCGLCHAVLAAGVYLAAVTVRGMRSPRPSLAAAALGITFAFNGLATIAPEIPTSSCSSSASRYSSWSNWCASTMTRRRCFSYSV